MSLSEKHRAIALAIVSPAVLDEADGDPPAIRLELEELDMMLAEAFTAGRLEALKPRYEGFYWITRISGPQEGEYQVAQWHEGRWWPIYAEKGGDGEPGYMDSDVEVHGDRLLCPGEVDFTKLIQKADSPSELEHAVDGGARRMGALRVGDHGRGHWSVFSLAAAAIRRRAR